MQELTLRVALAAIALAAGTLPASADLVASGAELLASPKTALGGALVACAEAAVEPARADAVFERAGWTATDGEGDGTLAWEQGDLWTMYWNEPGFCMVADAAIGTAEMEATLLGLTDAPPAKGMNADGCTTYDLGPVTATLTSSGNDPSCSSDSGAALRFMLPE